MKKMLINISMVIFLFAVVQSNFAEASWYGDEGTLEVGFNGSVTLPTETSYSGTGAPADSDEGTTMIMLTPFFNYFIQNSLHIGAKLMYISMITDTEASYSETTLTFFLPSVGYSLALSPNFQLDLSVNLGFMSIVYDDGTSSFDESSFSYGYSVMVLFPITENALFGIGITTAWYNPDVGESYDVTIKSTQIPFQMSIYW